MSLDHTDKSTLVQVMNWCCQATSHYLNQCWPSSMSPYGVTRPQWVKSRELSFLQNISIFKQFHKSAQRRTITLSNRSGGQARNNSQTPFTSVKFSMRIGWPPFTVTDFCIALTINALHYVQGCKYKGNIDHPSRMIRLLYYRASRCLQR